MQCNGKMALYTIQTSISSLMIRYKRHKRNILINFLVTQNTEDGEGQQIHIADSYR